VRLRPSMAFVSSVRIGMLPARSPDLTEGAALINLFE
jgi:hypothetical protein